MYSWLVAIMISPGSSRIFDLLVMLESTGRLLSDEIAPTGYHLTSPELESLPSSPHRSAVC